ncbi:MAG: hypothetical protein K8S94_06885 [Planctomycetia bacterium]|nr:hypothetical protein [Planctomycetia bacterium]
MTAACVILLAVVAAVAARADDPPLDSLQQAVVESLASTPRTTPAEIFDAVLRASEVEAAAATEEWLGRFVAAVDAAGEKKLDLLADVGDGVDAAALNRLERLLRTRDPAVSRVVSAIRAAARLRRRDPRRLAEAVKNLRSDSPAIRTAAADDLARAREDALPVLVPLLESTAAADVRSRQAARDLIAMLGDDARQPLLDWLASDSIEHWPGVIEALDICGARDIETFLLGPASVDDAPPQVRDAAVRVLARRAATRGEPRDVALPSRDVVEATIADRLDRVLGLEGLPVVDTLCLEPLGDPAAAAATLGGSVTGLVERLVWNAKAGRFDRVRMPPRAARAREALHLARDLVAIGASDPRAVNLALVARMESLLVTAGDPAGIPPQELRAVLAGPDGFTAETAADVLDVAAEHGLWEAAAGAAAALAPPQGARAAAPLAPAVRKALVRALAIPDAGLQFTVARTLALAAGDPPYAGSSRVLDTLMYAATSTGIDRAVVAHPDTAVVDALATGVSRFGYEPVRVSTGREAIFAAREQADTVLVLVAARIATPSALETVQFLQQQGLGDAPAVLVVVDPLDDDGRGCFLTQLLLKFRDLHGMAIVDRLDSMFEPVIDEQTGSVTMPPRFPDMLAQAVGPRAVDPASREAARLTRLARGREALALLAQLSRRGWDVRPAATTALAALTTEELYDPAVSLLATLGRPEAQGALAIEAERADLPAALRQQALSAFASSVGRHGVLLDCGQVRGVAARYTLADGASRDAPGDILEVLETADRKNRPAPPDASFTRPTR